jgi:hypothetical protein
MKPLLAALPLVAAALLGVRSQAPGSALPFDAPGRVRVTLGDESFELTLGERLVRADQPDLVVELLPTRVFTLPGACSFEFPREWKCTGASLAPEPVDAWWSVAGTECSLLLRRHGGDARAVLEEYARNLATKERPSEFAALELAGRRLVGLQVRYTSKSFHGAPAQERVQELYAWSADGLSYLLVLDKVLGDPPELWIDLATFPDGTPGRALTLPTPAAAAGQATLAATWRWLDG